MIERLLVGEAATIALARALAPALRAGDVVALAGELGVGKTVLARALIAALGGGEDVPSPTFTLAQVFDTKPAPLWHLDLYRLERPEDAYEIGIEEALAHAITVIEWPERLGTLAPPDRLEIRLLYGDAADVRIAQLTGVGAWRQRLEELTERLP
jgi:tRNA threonylcarbamoyladenosine biosynthesis protein TsaE